MTAKNGKPCKRCGTSRWYKDGHCAECHLRNIRDYTKEWQKNNPEKMREYQQRYASKNRSKINAWAREWRWANIEKARASVRKWKRKNPDNNTKWIQNNPEKNRAKANRYRARKIGSDGSYTAAEWKVLCKQYDYCCLACGKKTKLTADHVIPLSRGGSNDIGNIQPLCLSCNSKKSIRHIDYRTKGRLKRWIQKKLF